VASAIARGAAGGAGHVGFQDALGVVDIVAGDAGDQVRVEAQLAQVDHACAAQVAVLQGGDFFGQVGVLVVFRLNDGPFAHVCEIALETVWPACP
jgi:hypothetical protein